MKIIKRNGSEVPFDITKIIMVAADGKTAALLGQAYRCSVPTGDACRLFGRTAVSFIDFESLLQTPQDKQIAWALLKKLPKLNS